MALTVSELIAVLQTFDGWLPVVAEVDGFLAREVDAGNLRVGSLALADELPTPRGTYRRRVTGREAEEPALVIGLADAEVALRSAEIVAEITGR